MHVSVRIAPFIFVKETVAPAVLSCHVLGVRLAVLPHCVRPSLSAHRDKPPTAPESIVSIARCWCLHVSGKPPTAPESIVSIARWFVGVCMRSVLGGVGNPPTSPESIVSIARWWLVYMCACALFYYASRTFYASHASSLSATFHMLIRSTVS